MILQLFKPKRTPNQMLEDAAVKGDDRGVRKALGRGAQINQKGEGGWTALACAARYNKPKTLKLLLDRGADINLSTDEGKETPLILAVRSFNIECVKILLDRKASVDERDSHGETAFLKIAFSNEQEMAKMLLENGADINAKDRYGETALSGPLRNQRFERVKFLLENGADLNLAIGSWKLEDYANDKMAAYVRECQVRMHSVKEVAALDKKERVEDIIQGLESDLRK